VVIWTPAPPNTKSLTFKLSLLDEVPVAIEISNMYRREGVQVTLNRVRPIQNPNYQPPSAADESPGGIMGLISKFWYIPVYSLCFGSLWEEAVVVLQPCKLLNNKTFLVSLIKIAERFGLDCRVSRRNFRPSQRTAKGVMRPLFFTSGYSFANLPFF
jgi:hypothetical protein